MAVGNPMAARKRPEVIGRAIRDAWSQARVWPPSVVVHDPLLEDPSQVILGHRDHPIQHSRRIVPIRRSQNIPLRCPNRCLEDCQTHRPDRAVDTVRLVASSARCGFMSRSTYNASCFSRTDCPLRVGHAIVRHRDEREKITRDTPNGSHRGAETERSHGLGIVRHPRARIAADRRFN
jgi:hypothetical protein